MYLKLTLPPSSHYPPCYLGQDSFKVTAKESALIASSAEFRQKFPLSTSVLSHLKRTLPETAELIHLFSVYFPVRENCHFILYLSQTLI